MSTSGDFDHDFEQLAALAYRVAFRIVGDRDEAEDIAQETLARALVRWKRIAPYAEPWVARVASNQSLGSVRRRRYGPAPQSASPEPNADRIELARALRSLPRRQREVVVLRFLADLPEAAVASQLGCSTGSVKQHTSRALRALRPLLAVDPTLEGGLS